MSTPAALVRLAYKRHQADPHPTLVKLRRDGGRLVPGSGPVPARVMIVGEAPGVQEVKQGKPFCGPAGAVLDEWLALAEIRRADCFVTNAVKFRPVDRDGGNRTPRVAELQVSRELLALEATLVRPDWIVAMGNSAVKALWADKLAPAPSMAQAHGEVFMRHMRRVFVMYHPAAVLHDESKLDVGRADARELGRLVNIPW